MKSDPSAAYSQREIFVQASGLPTLEERVRFVRSRCLGDKQLFASVMKLLQVDVQASTPFDQVLNDLGVTNTVAEGTCQASESERLPRQLGPYTLLEIIGEGGMGNVYRAQQLEPVRRAVAVKLIKPGMDSKQVLARFEIERQALAIMDHPHIAKIFDAGKSDEGQPYFVMELVRGTSITEFCKRQRLKIDERLQLFIKTCQAVQHAHRRGIIHRDLKPSNILVELRDEEAVPKIIDFGVAKAIQQSLTDFTTVTGFAQMVGTPLYMSPEQAEMNGLNVDTRTDVYSLGVILYELLTGQPPLDRQHLQETGYDEMRRLLREQEPLRPSQRLSTLTGAQHENLTRAIGLEPVQLSREFRGELDWIAMKALEKDRRRRYESSYELALDVQRFLADLPVSARPPTVAYQFSKFARRHKALLVGLLGVFMALTIGLIASWWQAGEARRAWKLADERLVKNQQYLATAERLREEAVVAKRQSQKLLYISDMKLASDALQLGDIPRVVSLLERHRPTDDHSDLRGFEWYYLKQLVDVQPDWTREWESQINDVEVSADERYVAFSTRDQMLRLLNCETREVVFEQKSPSEIYTLCWSKDALRVFAGCQDGYIRCWQLDNSAGLQAVSSSVASAGDQPTDDESGHETKFEDCLAQSWKAHDDEVNTLVLSPDGLTLLSGSDDTKIRAWNAQSCELLEEYSGHRRAVEDLSFSPDGTRMLSASSDESLRTWTLADPAYSERWTHPQAGRFVTAAWSPCGDYLAGGDISGHLMVVDLQSGEAVVTKQMDGIESLCFVDEQRLSVGDRGGAIHFYRLQRDSMGMLQVESDLESQWKAHSSRVLNLAFGQANESLWSGSRAGDLSLWPLRRASVRRNLGVAPDFCITSRGCLLTCSATALKLVDLLDENERFGLGNDQFAWTYCAASTGTESFALFSLSGVDFFVKSLAKPVCQWALTGEPHRIDISPDGRRLALAWWDRREMIDVLDTEHPEAKRQIPAPQSSCVKFSPDGSWLAIGTLDELLLYPLNSSAPAVRLVGHDSTLSDAAFHPDGSRLVTVSHDRRLKVWEVASGRLLATAEAHLERIETVAFSADGQRLATGGEDRRIRLWHADTLQPVLEIAVDRRVEKLRFADSDRRLLALMRDYRILEWNSHPPIQTQQSTSSRPE